MTFEQVWEIVSQGGLVGLIVLILAAGAKRIWVWGHHYKELAKDRDEWREIALSKMELLPETVSMIRTLRER